MKGGRRGGRETVQRHGVGTGGEGQGLLNVWGMGLWGIHTSQAEKGKPDIMGPI